MQVSGRPIQNDISDGQLAEDAPRAGEAGPAPQRRSRTFLKEDGWYFMTRERVDIGPFASQELAESGVQDYVGFAVDAATVDADMGEA